MTLGCNTNLPWPSSWPYLYSSIVQKHNIVVWYAVVAAVLVHRPPSIVHSCWLATHPTWLRLQMFAFWQVTHAPLHGCMECCTPVLQAASCMPVHEGRDAVGSSISWFAAHTCMIAFDQGHAALRASCSAA